MNGFNRRTYDRTTQDLFMTCFKNICINELGFTLISDSGTGTYHRLKLYWSGTVLTFGILKLNQTDVNWTPSTISGYTNISEYKSLNYMNTRGLWVKHTGGTHYPIFIYATAGNYKIVYCYNTVSLYYTSLTDDTDVPSNTCYQMSPTALTSTSKCILSPILHMDKTNGLACDAVLDNIICCNSANVALCGKFNINSKSYLATCGVGNTGINVMVRYA